MNILETINSPGDLRALSTGKLPALAEQIREFLIENICRTGGHLASSLGTVELTLALHYCYDTPNDKIVWDVGHQAYAHKILTGRREAFSTIRQHGGLSGFPRISESEYDNFSVGHASTSISAALGLALGRDILGEKHSVVAVIGDGSMSGGLAFEGLNNLGSSQTNMTVILNDNEMSISKNVGALSRYFNKMLTDKRYNKAKDYVWNLLSSHERTNIGKNLRDMIRAVDGGLKHIVIPGKLFEDMGLRYFGPIDGHNLTDMIGIFKSLKEHIRGPVLVHAITKKGKGYPHAEDNSTKFHGVGKFARETGDIIKGSAQRPTYSSVFGQTMVELGRTNKKLVAITAAMPDGTGLNEFKDTYPNRFFDVGIAEGHAVTFAAGLALKGLKPVVAMYSSFLQRAYDQLMVDVALDGLGVVFCIDRAGLVGDDGPTHHGNFDISYLNTIPGAIVMAPRDGKELRDMMYTAIEHTNGPVFIRYPRGNVPESMYAEDFEKIEIATPKLIKRGADVALISLGDMYTDAHQTRELLADQGIYAALIDARFAKPLNAGFYKKVFSKYPLIATFENNTLTGGFGTSILSLSTQSNKQTRILSFGLPDKFIPHGDVAKLKAEHGLAPEDMAKKISAEIKKMG
ncbi:MAG: 1-deoxy-D-xylulose-5-phosphate synthase [Chitinispirillales bacterium]|nr:1-deoxy-D-xylulose-5-phosphate synthase [Chitinispirillales bacterium]